MIFGPSNPIVETETFNRMRDIISQPLVASQTTNQKSLVLLTFECNPKLISLPTAWIKIVNDMNKIIDNLKYLPTYSFIISSITPYMEGYHSDNCVPLNDENSNVEIENFFMRQYFKSGQPLKKINEMFEWVQYSMMTYALQHIGLNPYEVLRNNYPASWEPSKYGYPQINIAVSLSDQRHYDISQIYDCVQKWELPKHIKLQTDNLSGCDRESTLHTKQVNDPLILTYVIKNCYNKEINTLLGHFPGYLYDVRQEIYSMFDILNTQFGSRNDSIEMEVKHTTVTVTTNITTTIVTTTSSLKTCTNCHQAYPLTYFCSKGKGRQHIQCKWCSICRDKKDERRDMCQCTGEGKIRKRATFGKPGTTDPIWCEDCREDDYINVNDTKCLYCTTTVASFNMPGQSTPIWCGGCSKKYHPGAVNVHAKQCECKDIKHVPIFGLLIDMRPRWCKLCCPIDVIAFDVKNGMCKTCRIHRPTFGPPEGTKALYCITCAPVGSINFHDTMCERCDEVRPAFNYEGMKRGRWCGSCTPDNTVNVVSRKCNDISGCQSRVYYGFPGQMPTVCAQHRTKGMICRSTKQCEQKDCRAIATHGEDIERLRCEVHALKNDINIMEQPCSSCQLPGLLDKNGNCHDCDPDKFERFTKSRENRVRDLLAANGFNPVNDRIPNGSVCGRERPDFEFDPLKDKSGRDHVVIVEVDEDQHSGYPEECDKVRMFNLTQTYSGTPVFFIRYNPDSFRLSDGTKGEVTREHREYALIEWVKFALARTPTPGKLLEVVYLFYDGALASAITSIDLSDFKK